MCDLWPNGPQEHGPAMWRCPLDKYIMVKMMVGVEALNKPSMSAKCLCLFSQDCSLLSGSLALEALLIGVHCKKRYVNV